MGQIEKSNAVPPKENKEIIKKRKRVVPYMAPLALIPVLVEPCDVGPTIAASNMSISKRSPSRKNCNKAGSWTTRMCTVFLLWTPPLLTPHLPNKLATSKASHFFKSLRRKYGISQALQKFN